MSVNPNKQFWVGWMGDTVRNSVSPIFGQPQSLRVRLEPGWRHSELHFHARTAISEVVVPDDGYRLVYTALALHHGGLYVAKVDDLVRGVMVINNQTFLPLKDTHFRFESHQRWVRSHTRKCYRCLHLKVDKRRWVTGELQNDVSIF